MTSHPPNPTIEPSRRLASGRLRRTRSWPVAVAVLVSACGSAPPSPTVSPATSPTATPPAALEGLLVATEAGIHVTDSVGFLVPFSQPDALPISVSAGRRSVVAVDATGGVWLSSDPGSEPRSWRMLDLPSVEEPSVRLAAISPDGATLAMAEGDLQGRAFDLVLHDILSGDRRTLAIARGLDGPPIWLGNDLVAVHTLGPDQRSAMTTLDVASFSAGRESVGYSIAAKADGATVAFDDPVSGTIRVGSRADWLAARLDGMAHVPNDAGGAVTELSMDADGSWLAIVRPTDSGTVIELLARRAANWDSVHVIPLSTDGPVSIAWLR